MNRAAIGRAGWRRAGGGAVAPPASGRRGAGRGQRLAFCPRTAAGPGAQGEHWSAGRLSGPRPAGGTLRHWRGRASGRCGCRRAPTTGTPDAGCRWPTAHGGGAGDQGRRRRRHARKAPGEPAHVVAGVARPGASAGRRPRDRSRGAVPRGQNVSPSTTTRTPSRLATGCRWHAPGRPGEQSTGTPPSRSSTAAGPARPPRGTAAGVVGHRRSDVAASRAGGAVG